jgi:hypothetical protein
MITQFKCDYCGREKQPLDGEIVHRGVLFESEDTGLSIIAIVAPVRSGPLGDVCFDCIRQTVALAVPQNGDRLI